MRQAPGAGRRCARGNFQALLHDLAQVCDVPVVAQGDDRGGHRRVYEIGSGCSHLECSTDSVVQHGGQWCIHTRRAQQPADLGIGTKATACGFDIVEFAVEFGPGRPEVIGVADHQRHGGGPPLVVDPALGPDGVVHHEPPDPACGAAAVALGAAAAEVVRAAVAELAADVMPAGAAAEATVEVMGTVPLVAGVEAALGVASASVVAAVATPAIPARPAVRSLTRRRSRALSVHEFSHGARPRIRSS